MASHLINPAKTVFFCCDIQAKFQSAIYGWSSVIHTADKMIRFAKTLNVPVLVTEQNPNSLGPTDPALTPSLSALPAHLNLGVHSKTKFSMALPSTLPLLAERQIEHVVLFGIETHICVLQTALELLSGEGLGGRKVQVHVLADGVSSCNKEEIPIALARLARAGAVVTTSESLLFQLQHDAGQDGFKAFAKGIKESKEGTREAMGVLTTAVEAKL